MPGPGPRAGCVCRVLSPFSRVWLFATPQTVAGQAPLSMGFSRQEYWSGLPCPPPGNLPDPGIEPMSLVFLHWQAGSLPLATPGKPIHAGCHGSKKLPMAWRQRGPDAPEAEGGAAPGRGLTLMYWRSMSARTLKSEMYWPRIELPNWLLLPAKGTAFAVSERSG